MKTPPKIKVKRVYEPAHKSDGNRILVDRIWPRGLSKDQARIDYWAKALAPSTELRKWYQHDPDKWKTFKRCYFKELERNQCGIDQFLKDVDLTNATLLFASREIKLNNAHALKEYLISCSSFIEIESNSGS